MSRKHPGESIEYNKKKGVRERRANERRNLRLAKMKYFEGKGMNYMDLRSTPEGRNLIKKTLNRSEIKKIKISMIGEKYE